MQFAPDLTAFLASSNDEFEWPRDTLIPLFTKKAIASSAPGSSGAKNLKWTSILIIYKNNNLL
jgi:hypothetical protein